jgi:hypothetical protein
LYHDNNDILVFSNKNKDTQYGCIGYELHSDALFIVSSLLQSHQQDHTSLTSVGIHWSENDVLGKGNESYEAMIGSQSTSHMHNPFPRSLWSKANYVTSSTMTMNNHILHTVIIEKITVSQRKEF